jgi:hypothetical protein
MCYLAYIIWHDKIRVRNVAVRRGAFLLSPGDTELLGGEVKHLSVSVISKQSVSNARNQMIEVDKEMNSVPDSSILNNVIDDSDGISNLAELSAKFATERSLSLVKTNLFPSSEIVQQKVVFSPLQLQQDRDPPFLLESLEQHRNYNPIFDGQQQIMNTENRHSSFSLNEKSLTYINSCSLFSEEENNEIYLSDKPMVPEDLEISVDDPSATRNRSVSRLLFAANLFLLYSFGAIKFRKRRQQGKLVWYIGRKFPNNQSVRDFECEEQLTA